MTEPVADLVRKWDLASPATPYDDQFNQVHERILFLRGTHYYQYIPTIGSRFPDYETRLDQWIANVTDERDKQLLFRFAPRILFFGRDEFAKLYEMALRGPITHWLVDLLGLRLDDAQLSSKLSAELSEHTWFCPITDSLHISEFCHANRIGGFDKRPDWQSLAVFGDRAKIKDYMARPPGLRPGPLTRLVLLEDYVGSGTQMENALRFAAELDGSLPVLFVPLIISPAGAQCARLLCTQYANLRFDPVMELQAKDALNGDTHADPGSLEANMIELASRTYSSVVGNDAAHPRPYTCFGFLETGATIVLYSNTPANTLPIIQHQSNSWMALFPRSARIQ
jgi:hypothetical protein